MSEQFSRYPGTGLYVELACLFVPDNSMRPEVRLFGVPMSVFASELPRDAQGYENATFRGFGDGRFRDAWTPIVEEGKKRSISSAWGFSFLQCECGYHKDTLRRAGWCTIPQHGINVTTWPFVGTDEEQRMFGSSVGFKRGDLLILININGALMEVCQNEQRTNVVYIRSIPYHPRLLSEDATE